MKWNERSNVVVGLWTFQILPLMGENRRTLQGSRSHTRSSLLMFKTWIVTRPQRVLPIAPDRSSGNGGSKFVIGG